jgi:catechol 2,3-dioxygenase-like lactoylglutathione lyase family enzyme
LAYSFNHVHLKAPDPKKTADWYVTAFGFEIIGDMVRDGGDRFIRCQTKDGVRFNISGARTNEAMGNGDANAHYGIEHFGIEVDDLDAELKRLEGLGAKVMEGPNVSSTGSKIAFIAAPDDVRIEVMQLA